MRGLLRLKRKTSQDGHGHRREGGVREGAIKSLPESLQKPGRKHIKMLEVVRLPITFSFFTLFVCSKFSTISGQP